VSVPRRWRAFALALLAVLPGATACAVLERAGKSWHELSRASSNQAPDPATTPDAVIQVYAARTVGWRGVLGVHTWIAVKRSGSPAYVRYEVMGWGVDRGAAAVRVNRSGPDNDWFGARPDLLVDLRGADVDALIDRVEAAVDAYPYPASYRTWPGPNSNTFMAYLGRAVPEMRLVLPPTAIGKDYLAGGAVTGMSPSGTGVQLSLLGLAGLLVALDEGLEVNVLGLTFGLDVTRPALKLPGVGRLGVPRPAQADVRRATASSGAASASSQSGDGEGTAAGGADARSPTMMPSTSSQPPDVAGVAPTKLHERKP
jgi:hypothetical protein